MTLPAAVLNQFAPVFVFQPSSMMILAVVDLHLQKKNSSATISVEVFAPETN